MSPVTVWIDHDEARIFFNDDARIVVHVHRKKHHTHNRHPKDALKVPVESDAFFHDVAKKLSDATEVLVVGPGEAKTQFKRHLDAHHEAIARRVVAIESLDHPTEGQITALGRRFFKNLHRTGLATTS